MQGARARRRAHSDGLIGRFPSSPGLTMGLRGDADCFVTRTPSPRTPRHCGNRSRSGKVANVRKDAQISTPRCEPA